MSKDYFSFSDRLQEILSTSNYEDLENFKDPVVWESLTFPDKELLGQFFVMWGKELLNKDDGKALEVLDRSLKVARGSFKILRLAAKAYATQKNNKRSLNAAIEAFKAALEIDPSDFDIAHEYIEVLLYKGTNLPNEEACLVESLERCRKIEELAYDQSESKKGKYYWNWGKIHYAMAMQSGEASDFHEALGKYSKVNSKIQNNPEFLKDFGEANFQLARLLSRESYCLVAIESLEKAITLAHDCPETWFCLGICYMLLYENFRASDHFVRGNKAFYNAAKLDPNQLPYWYKWGQLQLEYGKHQDNLELVKGSLEKFARADSIEVNHPVICCAIGEALLVQGTMTEDVSSLKAAEKIIAKSLAINSSSELAWHLLGCCYNELGRYFNDEQYFYEAMEKFRHGLSLNKNSPLLWHGFAYSHFALADLKNDLPMMEKACQYCAKAMENGALSQSQCWNDWGVALMKIGEMTNNRQYIESAIEKFENALNLQNGWGNKEEADAELLYNYGCALDFLGDFLDDPAYYEKAILFLQKALVTQMDHPHARYNLALALLHLGERVSDVDCLLKAIEQFEIVLHQDPEDELALNECAVALINLGELVSDVALPYKNRYYFDLAETKLRQATSLGCIQAYYTSACFYSLTKHHSEALYYLEKAEQYGALPDLEEMLHDEWLYSLRQTNEFQLFLSRHQNDEKSG